MTLSHTTSFSHPRYGPTTTTSQNAHLPKNSPSNSAAQNAHPRRLGHGPPSDYKFVTYLLMFPLSGNYIIFAGKTGCSMCKIRVCKYPKKNIHFQLTVNVAALLINVVAGINDGDVPLNAVQLPWVNLIMDTLGAISLATEPNLCNNCSIFKVNPTLALRKKGHVVALTGDGTNDALALHEIKNKIAGIVVAMGIQGTEVAKERYLEEMAL
ncbi:hypothetical protein CTI12_AA532560 [Artemisia annua]|uniref:Uncharacterized protein n=1 Tax=Artemisia annua TaxID=35608 RepID=A0A2U1KXC3_ARTAN|nr:hypothetical protein CTI12_AA532560 [Artemisia annua]